MSRRVLVLVAVVAAVLGLTVPAAIAAPSNGLSWRALDTGGTNHFRGLSLVDRNTAWLGGYNGQVLRTVDGGAHWTDVSPKTAVKAALQFRDISASDANHAVAMAAGEGTDSRLFVTSDGGQHWTTSYTNTDPAAFFDCMAFADADHGLVMSDPVGGKFRILATADGGATWTVEPTQGMPKAVDGEAGFAASGECLTVVGRDAWFGSGGAAARVFHSTDFGLTWTVSASAIAIGTAGTGGINGLAFNTPYRGVVVGGDFGASTANRRVASTQLVGGAWTPAAGQPGGYRSGVTFVPGTLGTVLAVGLTGSDVSTDGGKHWTTFDTGSFDTVACIAGNVCWAAGDKGHVAVLQGL